MGFRTFRTWVMDLDFGEVVLAFNSLVRTDTARLKPLPEYGIVLIFNFHFSVILASRLRLHDRPVFSGLHHIQTFSTDRL